MLDISIAAAKHILAFLENAKAKNEKKEQPVRLTVEVSRGCADLAPRFTPNARIDPDEDTVVYVAGLTLICDLNKLPPPLSSVTVDVRVGSLGMILVLKSSNLQSCGCGQASTLVKTAK